ncbi:MAG TPA: helix-turn-helix domain-containing protein [Candidatus Limnocylindrales bacterium]|nr:helix-turn-helix domain-containing protein [Candidatus Limnocylindrales bacterium]
MPKPIATRQVLMEAVAREADAICAAVAADVGEPPDVVRADVELALGLLATPEQERPVVDKAAKLLTKRGAEAAVEGLPTERLIDRYMSALPAIWDTARDLNPTPDALNEVGSWLLRAADLAAMAIAEGYTTADREIVARDATARRAFLEELLSSVVLDDAAYARLRRLAVRYGLNPGGSYRLVAISPRHDARDDEAHDLADRLASRIGAVSATDLARAGGVRLPQVLARQRRIVVLARADWPGVDRLRAALDKLTPGWTAVTGPPVDGVEGLSRSLSQLIDTLRAADRMGHVGWVESADDLAVERLLLLDEGLLRAVVRRELGALLDVPRMGDELVETLRVFFQSGENMRETARRMHLASRTVAYRLARIEAVLGRPIDGEIRPRLSVALLAYRAIGPRPADGGTSAPA